MHFDYVSIFILIMYPYSYTNHSQKHFAKPRSSVALQTWEQEIAGLIPGSANIIYEDWW